MRTLTILLMALIACLLSCNKQTKEKCAHDSFIFEYSKADFESEIPPENWGYMFFAEIDNDSIIITDNFYLYQIFKKNYSQDFTNFHLFLCSLFTNKIVLKKENIGNEMISESIVFKKVDTFDNMDLSELMEQYFEDSDYLKINLNLTDDEMFSLLHLFFKNEYYVTHSDHSGLYSVWE